MKTTRSTRIPALLLCAAVAIGLATPTPAEASAEEAQACATGMALAGTLGAYRLRDADTDTLYQGYRSDYTLTLYQGNDYVILACGDGRVSDLDVYLYDENGNRVAHDVESDAQPVVMITPRWTGPFKARVVMHDALGGRPAYYTFVVLYRPR